MGDRAQIESGEEEVEGEQRHRCSQFGKTTRWRAGHALARRAACDRSLATIEWLEWLIVDNVESMRERILRRCWSRWQRR